MDSYVLKGIKLLENNVGYTRVIMQRQIHVSAKDLVIYVKALEDGRCLQKSDFCQIPF